MLLSISKYRNTHFYLKMATMPHACTLTRNTYTIISIAFTYYCKQLQCKVRNLISEFTSWFVNKGCVWYFSKLNEANHDQILIVHAQTGLQIVKLYLLNFAINL